MPLEKQQCRKSLYTSVHFYTLTTVEIKIWMHYAVGLCLRNHGVLLIIQNSALFIMSDLLFCFAYNCKKYSKFQQSHCIFTSFVVYLKKAYGIVQILNRTWHNNILMYTSILGDKQSTINSYIFFVCFSRFTYKRLGRHKLNSCTIDKLVHDSNLSPPRIDASHSWQANGEQTPM